MNDCVKKYILMSVFILTTIIILNTTYFKIKKQKLNKFIIMVSVGIIGYLTLMKLVGKEEFTNNKNFDVMYINLDKRKDRRDWMEKQLNGWSNVKRVNAVDGNKLNLTELIPHIISQEGKNCADKPNNEKTFGITLTRGAIGCALSHKNAWSKIKNKPVLILEDDARIKCSYKDIQSYIDRAPKDWEILYLGSGQYVKGDENKPKIYKVKHAYGLFGYIVRPSVVEKIKSVFPLTEQIDTALNKKGIRAYIIEPNMVEPRRDMGTNIQIKD